MPANSKEKSWEFSLLQQRLAQTRDDLRILVVANLHRLPSLAAIKHGLDLFLAAQTDRAGERVAVLHDGERRDRLDAEHLRQLALLVNVDAAELDLRLLAVELLKGGREHPAGLAPFRPEVDEDEARIVEHLGLEILARERHNVGKGARFDVGLALSSAAAAGKAFCEK